MAQNSYYTAVKEFIEDNPGFEELRTYTGLSVKQQLAEILKAGLREELTVKEILERDAFDNEVGE